MSPSVLDMLRCPNCGDRLSAKHVRTDGTELLDGVLVSSCGSRYPLIEGVPRILEPDLRADLAARHPRFFEQHPDLGGGARRSSCDLTVRTQAAFGDEWHRFPDLEESHSRIFQWYFEGPGMPDWKSLRVLDAGCGMGRWLHFARKEGAEVIGLDLSAAIEVAAQREGGDLVQADLCTPPLVRGTFDLVYCLGVLHHLEDPLAGLASLAKLVKPGGQLRVYVYRTLDGEPWLRRVLLQLVTAIRTITTRLPFWALHGFSFGVSVLATALFILPYRALRRVGWASRRAAEWPLAQYSSVPFRMLVAEQFDRFAAPIERRYSRQQVETWPAQIGFESVAVLPGLGWRLIAKRPPDAS